MNLPNLLTLVRIALIPVLVLLIMLPGAWTYEARPLPAHMSPMAPALVNGVGNVKPQGPARMLCSATLN